MIVEPRKTTWKSRIPYLLCILIALIVLNLVTIDLIKTVHYEWISDIIPIVKTLAHRFVLGQNPYDPEALAHLYWHVPSGYLPAHWMPCVVAEYFGFDCRTMIFALWSLAATVVALRAMNIEAKYMKFAVLAFLYGGYFYIAKVEGGLIVATVEMTVAAYYMLMIVGLGQRNPVIAGLFIALCLLSRYYIALWLPLWMFVMFVSGNRKEMWQTIVCVVFFVSIMYVIPFLSKDWTSFYKGYIGNYLGKGSWEQVNADKQPLHLYSGNGFAHLIYQLTKQLGEERGLAITRQVLFISVLVTNAILGIWFWFKRTKINYKLFLMASFKIYLSVFLAFIVVPF